MNLMTVEEFGKRIKVGRATAYRIVAASQVATTDVAVRGRPRLRISEQELKRYVDRRTEQGSAA
jgi:transposase